MKLETERLILREPRIDDWKDMVEALNNLEVSRHLMKVPHPFTKKDSISWIKKNIQEWKQKDKERYTFLIELKSEKKVIGLLRLGVNNHNHTGSTGSWINKKYWRNGYMTEAKIALNDWVFNKLKLRKLESSAFAENVASNQMQKKMGYKHEGKRIKSVISKATGKIHDENIYGLLKEDWRKISSTLKKEK